MKPSQILMAIPFLFVANVAEAGPLIPDFVNDVVVFNGPTVFASGQSGFQEYSDSSIVAQMITGVSTTGDLQVSSFINTQAGYSSGTYGYSDATAGLVVNLALVAPLAASEPFGSAKLEYSTHGSITGGDGSYFAFSAVVLPISGPPTATVSENYYTTSTNEVDVPITTDTVQVIQALTTHASLSTAAETQLVSVDASHTLAIIGFAVYDAAGNYLPGYTLSSQFGAIAERDPGQTPLPAALPLFATGLGALGLLARRRKRKAAALAA